MKPERVWLGIVALVWFAGVLAWIVSDEPGVPRLSVWLWLGAIALAFVPLAIGLVERLVSFVFRRRGQ